MSKNKNQMGFSIVELVIVLLVLGAVAFVGLKLMGKSKTEGANSTGTTSTSSSSGQKEQTSNRSIWQQTADGWQATAKAPACPDHPMLKMPADITKVTSVLYPGQTRGLYKPHGGLRFDSSTDNKIVVTAPFDGFIVKASRNFAEGTTEVQYGFDIMNNCGVMVRFGHLRELPANLQKIVEALPEASADSRIESVKQPVPVEQGEVLATKVGLTGQQNTFFDWGVYDYRSENEASKSAAYKAAHPQGELPWHAVCWLQDGWLPANDQSKLAALPGDKTSDYCK